MASNNIIDIINVNTEETEEVLQQVVFNIDNKEFSIDIVNIQEIIKYITPVKVPKSPNFIIGVINFRGDIIPVIDLRVTFNLPKKEIDNFNIITIVEVEDKTFGLLVDMVSDIVTLTNEQIQPTPNFGDFEKTRFIKSIGKIDDQIIYMLDLDKLVNYDDLIDTITNEPKVTKNKKTTSNSKKVSGERLKM